MRYSYIAIISVGGQLASLGFAFLFHFLMARMLGLSIYGELGVLLSTFTLLIFPTISIQAVLMREISKLQSKQNDAEALSITKYYFQQGFLYAIPVSILALLILFWLGLITHLFEAAILLLSIPFFYSLFIFNSYLQGSQKPIHFTSVLVSSDILRLGISSALVSYGFNLLGASLSYVLGGGLLALIALISLKRAPKIKSDFSLFSSLKYVFPTYSAIVLLLVMDLFFVRYFADAESAGLYTASSTLARAIFFVSIGVMNAFLPQSSKLDLKKDLKKIISSVVFSILLLAVFSLSLFLLKDIFLNTLYGFEGANLLSSSAVMGTLVASIFLLSLSMLSINLMWSQGEQKFPLYLSMLALLLALYPFYKFTGENGIFGAASASLFANGILFLLSAAAVYLTYKKKSSSFR